MKTLKECFADGITTAVVRVSAICDVCLEDDAEYVVVNRDNVPIVSYFSTKRPEVPIPAEFFQPITDYTTHNELTPMMMNTDIERFSGQILYDEYHITLPNDNFDPQKLQLVKDQRGITMSKIRYAGKEHLCKGYSQNWF